MAPDAPLVSVIIPTYNRAAYLPEAVESVFQQTYDNWELIIVDDGSTDGTRDYLRQLKRDRLRIIDTTHCANPARLRNLAIAQAHGKYLAFLDDDDLWMPEKLAIQIPDLQAHPDHRWSYTACRRIDTGGSELSLHPWRLHEGWILPQLIALDAWIAVPAVVVEAEAMAQIGGFDETLRFCEDYDAWLRLAGAFQARAISDVLVTLRTHPGNMSLARSEWQEHFALVYRRLLAQRNPESIRNLCRARYAIASVQLANQYRGE